MSTEEVKPITVKKLPLILNKNIILKNGLKPFNRNVKVVKSLQNTVQEDVIYTSKVGDFTAGEVRSMTIVNRLNVITKASKTVAKCQSHSGQVFEKTSEEITNIIGQNNYDLLFSSLCSIISQELKIRSINSLLTVPKKSVSVSCQTEETAPITSENKSVVDSGCQANETCIALEDKKKIKPRRRNRRQQQAPYAVKDPQPKRIVIPPENFNMLFVKEESVTQKESHSRESSLPDLSSLFEQDSNHSDDSVGRLSALSVKTTPELLNNPMSILNNVDKYTRKVGNNVDENKVNVPNTYRLHDMDNQDGVSPTNEKMQFGTEGSLRNCSPETRIKLLLRQGLVELKSCMNRDVDGNLPIHTAVLTNDLDLLRRQCFVMKMRGFSVDVPADGFTPLKMSLFQENTQLLSTLLHFGADPLDTDDEDRTAFHVAAELDTDHLQILVHHCQQNARKILHENEEVWRPGFESKPDEELAPILMMYINKLFNSQGYTPLMLASKVGKYNNVLALVESSRATVNVTMPNSGNTALYLAVGAACMDSADRGNKAKIVDHFRRTIEILVENGADPSIDNFASSSVNDLLTEFNIAELSMLIANKLTSIRYFDGQLPNGIKGSDFMLFKDDSGKVNLKEMKDRKSRFSVPKSTETVPGSNKTPVILENIEYKPNRDSPSATTSFSAKQPVKDSTGKVQNSLKKESVNVAQSYTPIVKNFTLNKPLLIKSEISNNKRKIDIVIDASKSKRPNKNI